ncbi:MAG: ATP-binding protein, partial [Thermodesulfobacteriota bacterium]
MRQLTVISGKGGTGKTTLTAAFASLAEGKVLADCDVDAADLHLILNPTVKRREPFSGGRSPVVDTEKCTKCGTCTEVCRFDAIEDGEVDLIACDHCGLCVYACPENAITMEEDFNGEWFVSETDYGPMVHARLGMGEENSGKLVTVVRKEASEIAKERNLDLVIIDGPPGIGCPVISSIAGVDVVLVVVEPTLSGIHDMERILGLTSHFKIPALACINKYDINLANTRGIQKYCERNGVGVLGMIPFDSKVIDAL